MFKLFEKKKVKLDESREKLKEQIYHNMYPSPCSSYDPNKWLHNVNDLSYISQSLEQDIDKILRISLPKSKRATPRQSIETCPPEKSPQRNVEQKKKAWYVSQEEPKQECNKLQISVNQIICEFPIQHVPNAEKNEEPKTPEGSKQFMIQVLSKMKERSLSKERDYLFQDRKSLAQNLKEEEFKYNNKENQQQYINQQEIKPIITKQNNIKPNPSQKQSNPPQKQSIIETKTTPQTLIQENAPKLQQPDNLKRETLPTKKQDCKKNQPTKQEIQKQTKIIEEPQPIQQINPIQPLPPTKIESIPEKTYISKDVIFLEQNNQPKPKRKNPVPKKKKNNQRKQKYRVEQVQMPVDIIEEKTKYISKPPTLEPPIFNVKQQWGRMKLRTQARKLAIVKTAQFQDLLLSIPGFHLHSSEGELRIDDLKPMQNQKDKYFQSFELQINPQVLIGPLKIQNLVKLHVRFKKGYSGEVFYDETLKEKIPTDTAQGKTLTGKLILANNSDHIIKLVCCLVNISLKK